MPYDQESGLVFSETIRRRCNCIPEQLSRCSGKPPSDKPRRTRGSRTLAESVTRRILQNLDNLEAGSLAGVPATLTEKLWQQIKRRHLDSLKVWRVFAQAQASCLEGEAYLWEYRCSNCRRFPDIIRICNNPDLCWLTDLSIDCRLIDDAALYQIPSLKNLRALELRESDSCNVTDRVMRRWADAAKDDGSFSKLESVMLDRYSPSDRDFTTMSLLRLPDFPMLQAYTILNAPKRIVQSPLQQLIGSFVRQTQIPTNFAMSMSRLPRLTVRIGTFRTRANLQLLASTLHFERGKGSFKAASGDSVEEAHGPQIDEGGKLTKKRKLRAGKAMILNDMLVEHS